MKTIGYRITRSLAALALVSTSSAALQGAAAAAPSHGTPAVPTAALCTPSFVVNNTQGISVFSPRRMVVFGNCFTQEASITIWDYTADMSLTGGWRFVPSTAGGQFSYTVSNAVCNHLMLVIVRDASSNIDAGGNGKVYGPCQPPPPVLEP